MSSCVLISFIHSFISYYWISTVGQAVGINDEQDRNRPCPHGTYVHAGEMDSQHKQINTVF